LRRSTLTILGVAPALLALTLCWRLYARPVHVRQVTLDAGDWLGKVVTVRGTVAPCFELPPVGWGIYCLDDGTGKVLVVTSRGVPAQGSRTSARGRVQRSKTHGVVIVTGRGALE